MRIIVNGAAGHMGRILCGILEKAEDMEIAARVDFSGEDGTLQHLADYMGEADMVIDFSHHLGTAELTAFCTERKLPVVLCTTGQTEEELAMIDAAAEQIPVFRSGNMSVGVALVARLVREIAEKFSGCDIEIVETHHTRKADAPSGTALMLAEAAIQGRPELHISLGRSGHGKREPDELGIQAIRRGNVTGIHEVYFGTANQTITLTHEAHDRALFADGALDAARFLAGKPAGMYNMEDLLG
ncbi:MAG: 4-hydroxy-tetrahydrodipicolinate reductase [Mogibacterium sp.]|nr:4-hydroxy-tetrahydrodipicolinate reductase [Mogibacterium sp.]